MVGSTKELDHPQRPQVGSLTRPAQAVGQQIKSSSWAKWAQVLLYLLRLSYCKRVRLRLCSAGSVKLLLTGAGLVLSSLKKRAGLCIRGCL